MRCNARLNQRWGVNEHEEHEDELVETSIKRLLIYMTIFDNNIDNVHISMSVCVFVSVFIKNVDLVHPVTIQQLNHNKPIHQNQTAPIIISSCTRSQTMKPQARKCLIMGQALQECIILTMDGYYSSKLARI